MTIILWLGLALALACIAVAAAILRGMARWEP
jgi:hypothetical protein